VLSGRVWLAGTIALTVGGIIVAIGLDPGRSVAQTLGVSPAGATTGAGAGVALAALLFLGSSVHVASTGFLFTIPEVREYARSRPLRYLVAPLGLVVGAAILAASVSPKTLAWALVAYFSWQFFHFQRQNLGMTALAAHAVGVPSLSRRERWSITAAGLAGTAGLVAHPALLQLAVHDRLDWLFPIAAGAFGTAVLAGMACLLAPRRRQAPQFAVMYLVSLCFFLPVFCFRSPYAAVAGLVLAHGGQYLLLVGLVAAPRRLGRARMPALLVLVNVAVLGGFALAVSSHLHSEGPALRAVYGAYLGVVMAHFVVDAGLWRLRDPFPRKFLSSSLPYLVQPMAT
jgi:hypothetical protein